MLHAAIGCLVAGSVLLAGAAWRLSQGPIQLGWLADQVRSVISDEYAPIHVTFDGFVLAWEGFHGGIDYPLDLRVSNIAVTDKLGRSLFQAPDAHVTLSLAALLAGHVVPRMVELDHARLAFTRDASGLIGLSGGETEGAASDAPAAAGPANCDTIRDPRGRPATTARWGRQGLLDQIRRAHFRHATVTLHDQQSGLTLATSDMSVDLLRSASGHIVGSLDAPLTLGGQSAVLVASADFAPRADTKLEMKLTPFRPAAVDGAPPAVAGVDLPVSLEAAVRLDAGFRLRNGSANIHLGEGGIQIGKGRLPLRHGEIALSGTPALIAITQARFDVSRSADTKPEVVLVSGQVARALDRITAAVTVGVSQIDMADLPRLWPVGMARAARSWIVQNITGGIVTTGSAALLIEANDTLHDVVLTKASGTLDGSNGVFTWLDDLPPVDQADVHLHLVDPDTLDIRLDSARQRIRNGGADLAIRDGQMRITGLSYRDQFAVIHAQAAGPVVSALARLKAPGRHRLAAHPIALKATAGDAASAFDIQFPLQEKLRIDDIRIHAESHLKHLRLLDVVAGKDLDEGAFDLVVDKEGLSLKGHGALAAIPVNISGTLAFNAGAPDQAFQKFEVSGQPRAEQLDAAGLRVTDVVEGTIPLTALVIGRRNGAGSVTVNGDLAAATLSVAPLAWSKPSGVAASASAVLLLSGNRITRIDRIIVHGDELQLNGSAEFADGQPRSVQLDTIRLGRTQARGTVLLAAGQPVAVALHGDQLDLEPKLTEKTDNAAAVPAVTKPPWSLEAGFDHVLLAGGERASGFLASAQGDGATVRVLDASGSLAAKAAFSIKITPEGGKRHLHVEAMDAGSFLRGVDTLQMMQSGRLTITGTFEALTGYYPLLGTMDIQDVRVKNSPVIGKFLQAITLYGLVDVLRGPGMAFSSIVAPFYYKGTSVILKQARAYNASLGVTARGTIDLSGRRAAINGTIVPAYFFNAMLGRLPLVGRLFSPEIGGGVFAARYGIDGPIDNPAFTLNPVSALTPGITRDFFGLFGNPSTAAPHGE